MRYKSHCQHSSTVVVYSTFNLHFVISMRPIGLFEISFPYIASRVMNECSRARGCEVVTSLQIK